MALKGQQVLAIVLLQGVRSRGGRPDAQLGSDVLPSFLVGALQQEKGVKAWDKDAASAVLYIEFDYSCTDSMRVHHRTLRSSYSQILPKLIPRMLNQGREAPGLRALHLPQGSRRGPW